MLQLVIFDIVNNYSKYGCLIIILMLGLDSTLHNKSKVLCKIK